MFDFLIVKVKFALINTNNWKTDIFDQWKNFNNLFLFFWIVLINPNHQKWFTEKLLCSEYTQWFTLGYTFKPNKIEIHLFTYSGLFSCFYFIFFINIFFIHIYIHHILVYMYTSHSIDYTSYIIYIGRLLLPGT